LGDAAGVGNLGPVTAPARTRTAHHFSTLSRATVITVAAATVLVGCGAVTGDGATGAARAAAASVVSAVPAVHQQAPATVATAAAKGGIWSGRVRAYGDSVMLGAKSALQNRLKAKVYAAESRQCGSVVARVRKAYKHGKIHGPVVIHTGTNGTFTGCNLAQVVKKVQRRHAVVLVNVKLPARYSWTSPNNHALAAIDRKWKNVVLLDWHSLAAKHRSWLYSDGIHLTPSGRTGYANAVAKLLRR
jgi:hypothetical protein